MFRIRFLHLLILVINIPFLSCKIILDKKPNNKALFEILDEIPSMSRSDRQILPKMKGLYLVDYKKDTLKVLAWNYDDINTIISSIEENPVGYKKNNDEYFLFYSNPAHLKLEAISEIAGYSMNIIEKNRFEWNPKNWQKTPFPPPPNLNPFYYVFVKTDAGSYNLVKKGNNISFPM